MNQTASATTETTSRWEQFPCDSCGATLFYSPGTASLQCSHCGHVNPIHELEQTIPELDYERHVFYERDVRSVTCNTRADGRRLLAEAAEIPIRPHTTEYPLAEANRALQDLKNDRINGTGVLIV